MRCEGTAGRAGLFFRAAGDTAHIGVITFAVVGPEANSGHHNMSPREVLLWGLASPGRGPAVRQGHLESSASPPGQSESLLAALLASLGCAEPLFLLYFEAGRNSRPCWLPMDSGELPAGLRFLRGLRPRCHGAGTQHRDSSSSKHPQHSQLLPVDATACRDLGGIENSLSKPLEVSPFDKSWWFFLRRDC